LYRSDTGSPLGIASREYKVVQPKDVMSFFDDVVKRGKFQLETAGALSGGKRIWALAKINYGAPIIGNDVVRPYLLLTTSFDGSMATVAKLTAIRVVCHNTLSVAIRDEKDRVGAPISTMVKVNHAMQFNAREVRMQLGIFTGAFEKWMIQTRCLARQEIDRDTASNLVCKLLETIPIRTVVGSCGDTQVVSTNPTDSLAYRKIMALFDGEAIGSDVSEGLTKWQFINSITQWVDHERGRDPAGRLNSAWFGPGEALKRKAYALALAG
jgi:phage/plasmid-like protein (TIGR03299 family)